MSDEFNDMWDDEGNNEGSQPQTPKGLREWAKKVQEQNEELLAWKREREAADRRSSLATALDQAGKDPAAVALIPADVTDADGVAKWLDANGALIKDKEAPAGQEEQTPEATETLSEEEQAQQAALSGAPEGGVPPSVSSPALDRLAQAKTKEEYWQIMDELRTAGTL